ncbi:DNA topoisomerase VI subunit A [Aureococcus anophagefferens]|nr:DNA topoisomerase VI subunit A [Aureococcus anophagefferens]
MGDSERILRKLPDADDRRSTLDGLRDDFEHALRPRVAAALAAPDVSGEALRPLVALYERLGLGEALRRDYAAARPGAARKRWFARTAADDAGLDLAPWLGAFLDDLLRDLEAEKAAAGAAFGEAHAPGVAALVAAETLKPLAESFRGKLDAAADRGPGGLEDCAAAHAACGVFLENLEQTLGLPAQSPLLGRRRGRCGPRARRGLSEDEGLARVPPLARRVAARRQGGAAAAPREASPLDRVAVDRALDDLAAEASALAFECAFAPVRSALRRGGGVSAATLKDKAAPYYCRAAVWAGNDDADPAPSDYATVVGEHLMGALRHLEPFLESPAWERIGDVLDADRLGLRALAAGEPLAGAHLGGDALAESSAPPEDADAAARFCSEWLHRLVKATAGPRGADHAFLAHLDAVATAAYEGRLPELLLRPMAQTPAAAALASLEAALRAKLDAPVEAAVEAAVDDGAEAPPADEAPPEDH